MYSVFLTCYKSLVKNKLETSDERIRFKLFCSNKRFKSFQINNFILRDINGFTININNKTITLQFLSSNNLKYTQFSVLLY